MASFNAMVSWSPYYQHMSFGDHIHTTIFCPWLPKSHSSYIENTSLNSLDSNFHLISLPFYILHCKSRISYLNQIWIHWDRNTHQSWRCGMKASFLFSMYDSVSDIGQFLPSQERKIGKHQRIASLHYVQSLTGKTALIKSSKVIYFGFTPWFLYTLVWVSTHRTTGISAPHSLPEADTKHSQVAVFLGEWPMWGVLLTGLLPLACSDCFLFTPG